MIHDSIDMEQKEEEGAEDKRQRSFGFYQERHGQESGDGHGTMQAFWMNAQIQKTTRNMLTPPNTPQPGPSGLQQASRDPQLKQQDSDDED